jgi:hypothetical protein
MWERINGALFDVICHLLNIVVCPGCLAAGQSPVTGETILHKFAWTDEFSSGVE